MVHAQHVVICAHSSELPLDYIAAHGCTIR
jgi:hypothetical protein